MSSNRLRATLAAATALTLFTGACEQSPVMVVDDKGYNPAALVGFSYHWAPGHDIALFIDKRGEPAGVDLEAAVRTGIAAWKGAGLLGEIRMTIVDDVHDADVIIHHADAPSLITIDPEECPFPADLGGGRTYFCVLGDGDAVPFRTTVLQLNDGSGGHVKMDVRINVGAISDLTFFDGIVAHELGHVLGIGAHSPSSTDLMFGTPRVHVPSADDVAALRYVLARPAQARF